MSLGHCCFAGCHTVYCQRCEHEHCTRDMCVYAGPPLLASQPVGGADQGADQEALNVVAQRLFIDRQKGGLTWERRAEHILSALAEAGYTVVKTQPKPEPRSYFDVVRSMTTSPTLLAAVDRAEKSESDTLGGGEQ